MKNKLLLKKNEEFKENNIYSLIFDRTLHVKKLSDRELSKDVNIKRNDILNNIQENRGHHKVP